MSKLVQMGLTRIMVLGFIGRALTMIILICLQKKKKKGTLVGFMVRVMEEMGMQRIHIQVK